MDDPNIYRETLFWVCSTIPQALAGVMALMAALVIAQLGNFSSLIRGTMFSLYQYWHGRAKIFTEISSKVFLLELHTSLEKGDVPVFLKVSRALFDKYNFKSKEKEHHRGATAILGQATLEKLHTRRQKLLRDTTNAFLLGVFVIACEVIILSFVGYFSANEYRAIPWIVISLFLGISSLGAFGYLAVDILRKY